MATILLLEILDVTTKIQEEIPELYTLLEETPLFLNYQNSEIEPINYQQYVESLELQLKDFQKIEFKNNNTH